jgi:hypothetical protein
MTEETPPEEFVDKALRNGEDNRPAIEAHTY